MLAKASDNVTMNVYRIDLTKIEMLLWLSQSRDLDQVSEELMGTLGLRELSTTKRSRRKTPRKERKKPKRRRQKTR